jgi:hypothetical protein
MLSISGCAHFPPEEIPADWRLSCLTFSLLPPSTTLADYREW